MTEAAPKPRAVKGGHWKKRAGLAEPGNGSWQQFQPGSEVRLTHGTDRRGARVAERLSPVAQVVTAELLGMPQCPDWLKDPSFTYSIAGWANAEARLLLYETWMDAQSDEVKYLATGAQEPLISRWTRLSELAARHRGRGPGPGVTGQDREGADVGGGGHREARGDGIRPPAGR